MRADIHDGPEHNALQPEARYIDARPYLPAAELPRVIDHNISGLLVSGGNGIFAAGDRRPETCLRDETYAQRRKSRPHDREKPAENWPFRR